MTSDLHNAALSAEEKRALLKKMLQQKASEPKFYPLSLAQQRFWILDRYEPNNYLYNISRAFSLVGPLQHAALEKAVQELVTRHESLRTTFMEREGQPQQVVSPQLTITIPVIDLQHVAKEQQAAEVRQWASEEAKRPFDLEKGPLLRVSLLQTDTEEHLLLLTMHHIISDGWSLGLLTRELADLYNAIVEGTPAQLEKLPVQFGDFATWQQKEMHSEAYTNQLDYWRHQLEGAPTVLELPSDRPRPAVKTNSGAMFTFSIPKSLTDSIKALARQTNVTLFMVLLAAYQTLLYRYTGQEDLLVGSPVAGRNRQETHGLIGLFVNTLVLRGQMEGNPTFTELLKRTRQMSLQAFDHQDIPFERLVEELQPERLVSHTPLVQVLFSLQNMQSADLHLKDVRLQASEVIDREVANFDLTLEMRDGEQGLQGWLQYNTDLFEEATVARMMRHLQNLLETAAQDPSQHLSDLPMLTEEERQTLLIEWNNTATAYPRDLTIHSLFEAQAAQTPDRVAVVAGELSLTYHELNARANQVAHALHKRGVGPAMLVGLFVERSPEMLIALLGILKAGAAYLPLDPSYPQERLAFMLEDANVSVLFTQTHLESLLPPHQAQVIRLDADWAGIAGESEENLSEASSAEQLAYVIFTSGSTGRPKGVCVPHRAVVRLVKETNYVEFSPDDVFLQFAPVSFDAATFEIWGSLLNGARLVLFPPQKASLEELGQVIAQYGVSTMWLTAGLFHQMVENGLDALKPVRQLLAGGDALSVPHVKRALEALDGTLINGYGPTENTTFTACYRMTDPAQVGTSVSIGRPISNTEIYVLDRNMQPVPIGVPGELFVGGDGLALGYLNRPELTAKTFIPHPFREGAKLYRTGDLVRYLPDGNVEFLGRIDNQVKIRGFRIELGEIENHLSNHALVKETTVRIWEPSAGDKRLVAYVVAQHGGDLDVTELRDYLKESLPDFMIPSAFVFLPELPLNRNGKVDAHALPSPDLSAMGPEVEYVAPRNPLEELIAEMFAQVLGVERVGITESFFDRGGHSLLATQVISRLRQTLQVEVPLRWMFEEQTVEGLVERIETLRHSEGDNHRQEAPALLPANRDRYLPLSFAQHRLWFLDQLDPGNPVYNIPIALRLSGSLNQAALEQSVAEIVRRHETLRTIFADELGQPYQVIVSEPILSQAQHSLELLPEEEQEPAITQWILEESRHVFDLQQGPLLKMSLLRISEHDHVLILNMHHIVSDGWSVGVLAKELTALYEAFSIGAPSPLQELPIQYADFSVWQREWLAADVLDQQMSYWKQQLDGKLPLLTLPTDRPRPAVQSHNGDVYRVKLSSQQTLALKAFCQREGTTLYMTLLAVYKTLLHRYTGLEDILVGSPIAGRNRAEIEEMIGFFVNTLVLRTDLSGDPSFRDLLKRVREMTLQAFDHQDVPFEHLVEELLPERHTSLSPLFQVMFVHQNGGTEPWELHGLNVQPLRAHHQTAKFDLTLTIVERGDELGVHVEYNTDLYDRSTIVRFCDHFHTMVTGILADPEQPISHLPMLTETERHQLLVEWNKTDKPFPEHLCLHQLFEEQVLRTPHNIAAIYGEQEITYAELETRANQLAHHLVGLGVGPDVPVGVCIERSLELVVALVGILKAGGAFVPLDTEAPTARIRQVLEDAQAFVCITQEHLRAKVPDEVATYVYLDTEADALQQYPSAAPHVAVTPDHLVSIYYTSGSTGKPKGVCSTHRGWVNRMVWMQHQYQLETHESVLQKTTLTFDDAACEFYWPLMVGARIALMEPGLHKDPRAILDAAIRYQVAFVTFVPSMLALVVDAITPQDRAQLQCLRHVGSSGEALRSDLVRAFRARLDCDLHNTWGATEVSIDSTIHTCTEADEHVAEIVSVGRPIDNNTCYVLDQHLQPVPIGVAGDLYLGGIGLATGYLNDPERTAVAFIANPFVPGERMYKTGDRGYFRADGSIMFLGRRDDQVKVRGQRVELAEIEAVLATHDALKHAVVVAFKRPDGYQLAAYYVLHAADEPGSEEQTVTAEALRAYMSERLPDYMVPWRFIHMHSLPTTVSGKIDRKLLPDPGDERPELAERFVAPRTHTEQVIATIWQEILALNEVGIHDPFFQLGGHSLTATRIISRINRELNVRLPLRDLFDSPTISGLAEKVERASNGAQTAANRPIPRFANRSEFPLSHAQQRFWFQYQFDKETMSAGVVNPHLIEGPVDTELLLTAYQALVQRHDIMRTTIAEREEGAVQLVHPHVAESVQFTDYTALSADEQAESILQNIADEMRRPFDLTRDLFFRNALYKLSANKHLLLLNVHPIAYDGWSITVFLQDLTALYRLFKEGRSAADLPATVQYGEYAAWQHEQIESGELDDQQEYWQQKLARDVEPPKLPYDFEEPSSDPMIIRQHAFDPDVVASLRQLSTEQGTTLYLTLLAGLKIWLSLMSEQEEITICSPISGRSHSDLESVLGLMVNPLALRTDLSGNPTGLQVLERVKETALGAFANQDYPFDRIMQEVRARHGKNASQSLYTVVFVGQNAHVDAVEIDSGVTIKLSSPHRLLEELGFDATTEAEKMATEEFADDPTVQFDLHIGVFEAGEHVTLHVTYNNQRFSADTVDQYLSQYEYVLLQFATNPRLRLSQLEVSELVDLF